MGSRKHRGKRRAFSGYSRAATWSQVLAARVVRALETPKPRPQNPADRILRTRLASFFVSLSLYSALIRVGVPRPLSRALPLPSAPMGFPDAPGPCPTHAASQHHPWSACMLPRRVSVRTRCVGATTRGHGTSGTSPARGKRARRNGSMQPRGRTGRRHGRPP